MLRWIWLRWIRRGALSLLLMLHAASAWGAPIVELTADGRIYRGRNVIHNRQICWLAARDGSYERIDLSRVKKFRKPGGEFQSVSPQTLATQLRAELGRNWEVQTSGTFVVCAPQGKASCYLDVLQGVERSFNGYFSRRGWQLDRSDYPLVLVVHASRQDFDRECVAVGMPPNPLLKGFYHPQTNRVTLYDLESSPEENGPARVRMISRSKTELSAAARQTTVHEAIHQLAFNTGLHQRVGVQPRWVVEGLATLLEAGALGSRGRDDVDGRINRERLDDFRKALPGRKVTIARLLTEDEEMFASAPLDFYAEAWALTFYLAESRRVDYVRYLKLLANRDPLSNDYPPVDRLADFQKIFGKDLHRMDVQFLRFLDGLEL